MEVETIAEKTLDKSVAEQYNMSKGKTNGAGKGSRPRPVNKQVYDQNYVRIFKKHKKDVDVNSKTKGN